MEDDPDYSDLVGCLLREEEFEPQIELVSSRESFESALWQRDFDLILADHGLPDYDGLRALGFVRSEHPKIPFLIVSGTIGEQTAISSLAAGATDYVLKQWPERLVPAIRRALQEVAERAQCERFETELHRREDYFRTITENALDIVTILDANGNQLYNSPSLGRVLGYAPNEVHGQSAFNLIHPDDLARVKDAFQEGLQSADSTVRHEFRIRHRDGSWRHLEAVGQNRLADKAVAGVVINCRDVTDRKLAEEELRRSEQRFRMLFEGSRDAIFVEDLEGKVLDVNPAACQLHGIARKELIGKNVAELVPPEFRQEVLSGFQALVEGRQERIEGCSWTQDHRSVPVEVRASRVEYAGRPAMLLHVRDITDRKAAEAALRSSEMLFHSVWENSVDGMRLTDEDGTLVAVNETFCRLVGRRREELEGRPFTVLYGESADAGKLVNDYREQFRKRIVERQVERRLVGMDGVPVSFEDTTSFVEIRGQAPLLLCVSRDITAQKRLEEQLRQSQKMEAIGQLAGGVAHDFNNILTVIHGHASLLMAATRSSRATVRSAQQIVQAADRAAQLTRQLLTFSRRQVMQPRRLDLNEVVTNMTRMLARILGEDIALRVQYFPQSAMVTADAGMMEQVLLNLAVNSRDAMPKGGILTVRISVDSVSSQQLSQHPEARSARYVCLAVLDTGCGIPSENLQRIFEPFFTTKEVGKGTGLGLATVYGIVNQHQGWIEVESAPGRGAEFRVFLPCAVGGQDLADEGVPEKAVRGGHETILVVEDEAPLRELVCSLLECHGYQILQAESGARALEVWHECRDKVDLVLTDLVMPDHMNGRELAEKLWAERPELKVIFTSGYSAEAVGKDFVLSPGLTYLQKPYQPQKLALTVRDCLDTRN